VLPGFRAIPIASQFAAAVRASRRDAEGGAVEIRQATDRRFPCRHCLAEVRFMADALLLPYWPFRGRGAYATRGPIFLCAEPCRAYQESGVLPEIVATRRVNLRAYDGSETMIYRHSCLVEGDATEAAVNSMLGDPEVAEVHAHTALHGCFLCRLVRA
jgi:hypothetical protein